MKVRNIPTETPSSNTSTRKSLRRKPNNNPSSPSTQEEGTGWQLQEWRNRLSPQRRSAARERARLRGQEARQGSALWGVRCDHQHWIRQRRDHERHRRVRRAVDPLLARTHGTTALSQCTGINDHCGGSNGARVRLWKRELQKLADETGLTIRVHHYPPGTSKWNKIEHRLFCHITQNWRGRPLTARVAVVELIGATTTKTGLKVESALDTRSYQKGIKVSKAA